MKDIILYHGSRGGISGNIMPSSRTRCDFGSGFYMNTDPDQTKGLAADALDPVIYKLKLKLSQISEDRIAVLEGMDWAYYVLANRERVPEFLNTKLAREIKDKVNRYDIIIGPIADDRLIEAIRLFENFSLTDKGLLACLRYVNHGHQITAKTQEACKQIEVLYETYPDEQELEYARQYASEMRKEARLDILQTQMQFHRKGLYLNEIIDQTK